MRVYLEGGVGVYNNRQCVYEVRQAVRSFVPSSFAGSDLSSMSIVIPTIIIFNQKIGLWEELIQLLRPIGFVLLSRF